jgi:hypothetical protein
MQQRTYLRLLVQVLGMLTAMQTPVSWLRGGNGTDLCHGFDGKVPDSAVMTTRAGSILVMDYS